MPSKFPESIDELRSLMEEQFYNDHPVFGHLVDKNLITAQQQSAMKAFLYSAILSLQLTPEQWKLFKSADEFYMGLVLEGADSGVVKFEIEFMFDMKDGSVQVSRTSGADQNPSDGSGNNGETQEFHRPGSGDQKF